MYGDEGVGEKATILEGNLVLEIKIYMSITNISTFKNTSLKGGIGPLRLADIMLAVGGTGRAVQHREDQ